MAFVLRFCLVVQVLGIFGIHGMYFILFLNFACYRDNKYFPV